MTSKCVPLHIAVIKSDWECARAYDMDTLKSRITDEGETALHVAALAEKLQFVVKLLDHVDEVCEYLEMENYSGNTALCYAATSGDVKIAQAMLDAYSNEAVNTNHRVIVEGDNPLANEGEVKPLSMAAMLGHCDMVKCLLRYTRIDLWSGEDRVELFTNCISIGLCGEASKMLGLYPDLATARNKDKETGLYVLALKSSVFVPKSQFGWTKYLRLCEKNEDTRAEAVKLIQKLYKHAMDCPDLEKANRVKEVARAMFAAAEEGNIEFLIELVRLDPDLVWKFNKKMGTIFHIAVLNRHESIFSLLSELGSIKDWVAAKVLDGNRNMLHLAAKLAPQAQLDMVSGAALQMHRELLWYKVVEKIVPPHYTKMKNSKGKTPHMLFIEKHKNLMAAGEKWMKDTSKASMLVAALIATVMFTAAFTLPGGYKNSSGEPVLINKFFFFIFFVADALALFCSTTSILMFYSILTSRYTEKDFLESLPFRLMVGVTSLFVSVAAMMVAFCTTFPLYYPHGDVPSVFGVFAVFSCVPTWYVSLKYPLFVDLVRATLDSRFMFRPRKKLFV